MDDTYIKVSAIQRKLKQAQEEHAVLYIHALGGYGKTAATAYFLRNKAHLYLSGAEGVLNQAPPLNQIKQTTVVVDDISPIVSESSLDRRYIIAAEPDFLFDAAQTKKLMEAYRRTYNKIENGLFCAIVQYCMKLCDWQKSLGTALQTAQAAVLRALARQPQPLATVSALLWARDGPQPAKTETDLATASFILDFGKCFSMGGG